MELGKDAFWKFDETRAKLGYKSAWLVKDPDDPSGKFSLIGLTTTAPYPFGEADNKEIDVLQSANIGRVPGKTRLEETDVPVYHHRDNVYRYERLQEKGVLEFMTINSEKVGYRFSGSLKYRPDTAENTENTATVRVTPIRATEKAIKNARPFIIESFCFLNAIPETVKVNEVIDFTVIEPEKPTYVVNKITTNEVTGVETEALATVDSDYSIEDTKITFKQEGLYVVKATSLTNTYAPWITTIYVEETTAE